MKKCLRKTAMCLATVGAVASMNLSVFAVSPITSTGGTADTTINYTVDPDWSVTIPTKVDIKAPTKEGELKITSTKMNLQPNQTVEVKMTTMPTTLERTGKTSDTVDVKFTLGDSPVIEQGTTVVAKFTEAGNTTNQINNAIKVKITDNDGKAGTYTGTAIFTATLK